MQNLDIFIANLGKLIATILTNPGAALGAICGAFIILVLSLFLVRRCNKKYVRLQDKTAREHESLEKVVALKTRQLDIATQTCEEQKVELAAAKSQIVRFEESILGEKTEQQLRQIEALTETISSEFSFDNGSAAKSESNLSGEPIPNEALIDRLGARVYQQLSSLRERVADQSQLINELQAELNAKKGNVAQLIIAKSQALPNIAKTGLGMRVIKPFQLRVDGLKQTVSAKFDQLMTDPILRRVNEAKAGIGRIPVPSSANLNKFVLKPLNKFIEEIKAYGKKHIASDT